MRILYLDIETAPALAYIWDLKTHYVPVSQIAEDGYILCWAAAWAGEDHVIVSSLWDHGYENMIQEAWNLLDEADMVIHYNGLKFDIPRLNTEFLVSKLGTPSSFHQIDLYRTVTGSFRVLSKSMNHMLRLLSLDEKLSHKGMDLWTGCMHGVKADQREMERYNIQDVEVMEDLYTELRPWIKTHPNVALWGEDTDRPTCKTCGSHQVKRNGVEHTAAQTYQRYKCNVCRTNMRGRKAIKRTSAGVLR